MVLWVDGESADDFAGGGVDDADAKVGNEQDDAGSVEGSSEADVVHLAGDAQADSSVGDAVVADAVVWVVALSGGGFGSRGEDGGGSGSVRE